MGILKERTSVERAKELKNKKKKIQGLCCFHDFFKRELPLYLYSHPESEQGLIIQEGDASFCMSFPQVSDSLTLKNT